MADWIVRTKALRKQYRDVTAVESLDLHIGTGEIYGLLGPNGAGKTTTIRLLLGMVPPTSGEMFLLGTPYAGDRIAVRRRIGVVPEKHPKSAWPWLTGREYLEFFSELHGVDDRNRIADLLRRVRLDQAQDRPINEYSRGMLQRLSICRALLPEPELLILDEPISGIDPIGVKEIRDVILEENAAGRTILISSHILSEVEKVCHRVGIMDRGVLVREVDVGALSRELSGGETIEVQVDTPSEAIDRALRLIPGTVAVRQIGTDTFQIDVGSGEDLRAAVSSAVVSAGAVPIGIRRVEASLEDAFVAITQTAVERIAESGEDR
jgi:ABC-2 type transport system ATP-binding protein